MNTVKEKDYKKTVEELAKCLEIKEFKNEDNEIECRTVFTDAALKNKSEEYQELSTLIHTIASDTDFIYVTIYACLNWMLSEQDTNDIDTIKDNLYEWIESQISIYYWDLTGWLHASNNNIDYITEALGVGEYKEGFALLQEAQRLAIQEISNNVISLVEKLSE